MLVSESDIITYECKNALSARRDPETVQTLIDDELRKGFINGLFDVIPFTSFRVSPIGIATHKYSLKKRLILDLSSPHNKEEHCSVNDLIDKHLFRLLYKLEDAINVIQDYGPNSICCKVDISDAFKQLPISPKQWHLFCFKWDSKYYNYVRLPFGCCSSQKLFDVLSTDKEIPRISTRGRGETHTLSVAVRDSLDCIIDSLWNYLLSNNTSSVYNTGIDLYIKFLLLNGSIWDKDGVSPVSESILMRFVAYCDEHKQLRHSTINLYLCGIRCGEFTVMDHLCCSDMQITTDCIFVTLKKSKTDPFRQGITIPLYRTLGRWSSDCYTRYIHTSPNVLKDAEKQLAETDLNLA
ncbi:unnamed protein product [Mytilus coruscus]|uniref:Reverse transcriptase domain-containing protein n=1 Tax=Mytilus coruscus TaxID=42192 RepID=A0A6J8A982_MYTCO|nr:unnamed protein product [Mytilus coruscus]